MINPDIPVPRWRQLANILRGQIERGELSGKLPGERYLSQEYGVAMGTVRQAFDALREEGLIETVHGIGSFVVKQGS